MTPAEAFVCFLIVNFGAYTALWLWEAVDRAREVLAVADRWQETR